MAELKEGTRYGLTSLPAQRQSGIQVKLTDSALKALEEFYNSRTKENTNRNVEIRFTGNRGLIRVPCSKAAGNDGYREFSFGGAPIQGDPKGSFECIKQTKDRHGSKLEVISTLAYKMTVNANDDVYQSTKQRMAQVDQESKSQCAKEIKVSDRHINRKVKKIVQRRDIEKSSHHQVSPSQTHSAMHTAAAANARSTASSSTLSSSRVSHQQSRHAPMSSTSSSHYKSSSSSSHPSSHRTTSSNHGSSKSQNPIASTASGRTSPNPAVYNMPLRERIIHLCAIRAYKKLELFGRLNKDGIKDKDRQNFGKLLRELTDFSPKDNVLHLKKHLRASEVRMDWPGYTDADRQLLKRYLAPHHQPERSPVQQGPTSTTISPTYSTTSSQGGSPNHSQKRPTSTTDDVVPPQKKSRISHSATSNHHRSSSGTGVSNVGPPHQRPNNLHHKSSSSQRHSPTTTTAITTTSSSTNHSNTLHTTERREASPKVTSPITSGPDLSVALEKARDTPKQEVTTTTPDLHPHMTNKTIDMNGNSQENTTYPSDTPDFITKYTTINNPEQRNMYKSDYVNEYELYLKMHDVVDKVSNKFANLGKKLKAEKAGSESFKAIRREIMQEYHNVKSDPKFLEYKKQVAYLHRKLSHIKRLVTQYDQNRLILTR